IPFFRSISEICATKDESASYSRSKQNIAIDYSPPRPEGERRRVDGKEVYTGPGEYYDQQSHGKTNKTREGGDHLCYYYELSYKAFYSIRIPVDTQQRTQAIAYGLMTLKIGTGTITATHGIIGTRVGLKKEWDPAGTATAGDLIGSYAI